MMNVLSSHPQNLPHRVHESCLHARPSKIQCLGNSCFEFHHAATLSAKGQPALVDSYRRPPPFSRLIAVRAVGDNEESSSGKDDDQEKQSKKEEGSFGLSREDLERMLGPDDAKFNGLDLANLIRKKYGRSYDVQLIKKEFMGRNLLAMNVMWKYREQVIKTFFLNTTLQRSFPLSEEEYLLRLDDVANTLKCWGAVSHVRNTLEKLKERPRIGKAVSIFIDMDESGGRSNEWIYK